MRATNESENWQPVRWQMRGDVPVGQVLELNEAVTHEGPRFCIYARVSTQNQGKEGDGVESQLTICRTHAARKGGVVFRELRDVRSGANPSLGLLEALVAECGRYRCVLLVKSVDRLARNPERRVKINELLARAAVDIVFVTQQDTESQHMHEFFAEHERRMIQRRVRDAMQHRREQQRWSYKDATRKNKLISAEAVMLGNDGRQRRLLAERLAIQHHVLGWHRMRNTVDEIVELVNAQFPAISWIGRNRIRRIIKEGALDPFELETRRPTDSELVARAKRRRATQAKIDARERLVTRGRVARAGRWLATGAHAMSKTESVDTLKPEEREDMEQAYAAWCVYLARKVLVPECTMGLEANLHYVCKLKDITVQDIERALPGVPRSSWAARLPPTLRHLAPPMVAHRLAPQAPAKQRPAVR